MRTRFIPLVALCGLPVVAAAQDSDKWQFQVTPYLWLPTIGGDVNHEPPPGGGGSGGPGVEVGPTDWLDLLNGAALLNGSMRKGRFSISADFVWLSMESDKDQVKSVSDGTVVDVSANLSTETDLNGVTWTLVGGYTLWEEDKSIVDLIAGVRYFDLDITTNWNLSVDITGPGGGVVLPAQGSIESNTELWNGLVGVHGQFGIGEGKWSVPYYLDVGTGDSDLTWQAMAGFAYSYQWGDLMLVYRHLYFDEGGDGLMEDFSFTGPAFGARFRF